MMRPQDILVLLELALRPDGTTWRFHDLAQALGMSQSEIHASIKRSTEAKLYDPLTRRPKTAALIEFLVHGLKYAFPAGIGTEVRGMPTAHSAPPLATMIVAEERDKYVWPTELGKARGFALEPLYRCVPRAAAENPALDRKSVV